VSGRAAALREAFDRAFAEPAGGAQVQLRAFLAIGIGGAAHAIDIAEISGLHAGKPITALPDAAPEFLGLAGFRGVVVPVYDLRVLLGQPAQAAPRWLVTAQAAPVAFAFDAFEGHLRVPLETIVREEEGQSRTRRALRMEGVVRPIVEIASLVEAVKIRAQAARQGGE
jgi:purine-binding chemotaxis protein CheW